MLSLQVTRLCKRCKQPLQSSLRNRLYHRSINCPEAQQTNHGIKFICNYFCDLLALQNVNVVEAGDQCPTRGICTSLLWLDEVWHIKHVVNFISMRWLEVPLYLRCGRALLSAPYPSEIVESFSASLKLWKVIAVVN